MRKKIRYRQYANLARILSVCDDFGPAAFGISCDENHAKEILLDFFDCLIQSKPDEELYVTRGYYSFLINMVPMRNAIKQKQYALACHELATLFAYEPVLQLRIYYNLISLYRNYLEEKRNAPIEKEENPEKDVGGTSANRTAGEA